MLLSLAIISKNVILEVFLPMGSSFFFSLKLKQQKVIGEETFFSVKELLKLLLLLEAEHIHEF